MTAPEPGTLRIAIPCFGEEVAPLFGAARRFRIWDVRDGRIEQYGEVALEEDGGIVRTRLMRDMQVNVIVANGIEGRLRQMLETEGRIVVDQVIGTATDALFGYLAGRFRPARTEATPARQVHHTADVVAWTAELFERSGWQVRAVHDPAFFPVDLVCKTDCPVCHKPVRIAVCCGAHAYRVDEEIREFHRVTASGYHARVYVHQAISSVEKTCRSFGVELLDPSAFHRRQGRPLEPSDLPPLVGSIEEHVNLNQPSVA